MQFFMQMHTRMTESVLERILGVIRFRGFGLMEMNAHTPPGQKHLEVTFKVRGDRTGDNLKRQLEKLLDVYSVDMFTLAEPIPVEGGIHLPLPAQPVGVAV